MPGVRETWEQDPEFAALPEEVKNQKITNYFDQEIADDEFRALPQEEQNSIRQRYLDAEGITESGWGQPLTDEEKARIPVSGEGLAQWDINTKEMKRSEGGGLGEQLSERARNTRDFVKRQFTRDEEDEPSLLEEPDFNYIEGGLFGKLANSAIVGIGQTIGAGEDIAGAAIAGAYKALTPDEIEAKIHDAFINFSTTKAGQTGLKALSKGMKYYDDWAEKNPDDAMMLGSMLNIMGGSLAKDLVKGGSKLSAEQIIAAGKDAVHELGKFTPRRAREKTKDAINKYFIKAISPAKGIAVSDTAIKDFKESASNAVYDIVENKKALKLTDAADMPVDYVLPRTRKQFNEAIGQRKRELFKQYDGILDAAGEQGLTVDLSDLFIDKMGLDGEIVEAPLTQIANSVGLAAMDKDTVDRAMELIDIFTSRLDGGKMSAKEAQKMITAANNLKSKRPGIDNLVADFTREKLDEAVDSLADARFSNLKKTYGYYKAIEESVSKSAFAGMKEKKGILEKATSIFSLGEIAKGVVKGDMGAIAKGMSQKAAEESLRRLNTPDKQIQKMFEAANKAYENIGTVRFTDADKIIKENINKNIDDGIKLLEGQRPKQLTEGAIRMPGPGPEPLPDVINMPASLREFKNLKFQGKVNDTYHWRDNLYGGNFQTKTKNPSEVRKALRKVRDEFKKSGNEKIKVKEEKPFNAEEWMKELRKEVNAELAKKKK